MPVTVTTAPTEEPLSRADLKDHLRLTNDDDDEDGYLEGLIVMARRAIEVQTRRSIITQTLQLTLDGFPRGRVIKLPRPPVASVTSVKYDDTAGTEQTLSTDYYQADTYSTPGRVVLKDGYSWPSTINNANSVRIVYVAGYGAATDVPEDLIQAIKFLAAHWYANREPVATGPGSFTAVPQTFDFLAGPYRVY